MEVILGCVGLIIAVALWLFAMLIKGAAKEILDMKRRLSETNSDGQPD